MDATIRQKLDLPGGDGAVTLYDWMADDVRDGRNLIRTDQSGHEMWRAKPVLYGEPRHEDCFTDMYWDGASLTAQTFSGYRVAVSLSDGSVSILEFTK